MVWHTHRLAWIALPLFVLWMMTVTEVWPNWQVYQTSALYHVNLLVLALAPLLGNIPDWDQNNDNTPADIMANFWKQWIFEQSMRILFKKMSWWEHRWFTHSIVFILLVWLVLSPILLFWFWIYDLLFLLLALASHMLIDMFNNSWARALWPLNLKLNYLNLVPNLIWMKLNKKNQVRSKWWDIPLWFKLIWIVWIAVLSTMLYIYLQWVNINIFIKAALFIPIFYVFLKLVFVKTWSDDEVILWQYPLIATIFLLVIYNIGWLFVAFNNATTWLAQHFIFFVVLVIYLAIKWVAIISKDFKRFLDTKELWWAIASIIVIWALIKFPMMIDSIRAVINWERPVFSITDTYKQSVEKLKTETTSLFSWKTITIDESQQKMRWIFQWLEDFKQNVVRKKREEYVRELQEAKRN